MDEVVAFVLATINSNRSFRPTRPLPLMESALLSTSKGWLRVSANPVGKVIVIARSELPFSFEAGRWVRKNLNTRSWWPKKTARS
jgi:hypothetical protein